MFSFLSEITRNTDETYAILVMDEQQMEPPRQYRVRPRHLQLLLGTSVLGLIVLVVSLVALTPLRELVPGYGSDEMRQNARLNALRLAALQDSLEAQQQYMLQLRQLMMGQIDSALTPGGGSPEPEFTLAGELATVVREPRSKDWTDHAQPALTVERLPVRMAPSVQTVAAGERSFSRLQFPVLPPVNGFLTRGFDARIGHYAADIAVEEGTVVRAIADGHVIFADWTQEGGFAISVQHVDGYVSVYKHNERLLKRVGDRVRNREAIATSGNSGEVTTGPHLHFELWHNGLAQDPRSFFIGW